MNPWLLISSTSLNKPFITALRHPTNFASDKALMAVGRGLTVLQLDEMEFHNGEAPFFHFGSSASRRVL
jgi:hypothetical protein